MAAIIKMKAGIYQSTFPYKVLMWSKWFHAKKKTVNKYSEVPGTSNPMFMHYYKKESFSKLGGKKSFSEHK